MDNLPVKPNGFDHLAEAAKDLIQQVIIPPVQEVGLLIADQIKLWRFKNQVNIINKADEYLKSKNIKTKKVSLKVLVPLLEECSLEEDESMKDRWSALLANTIKDSSQIELPLFSYILSQMSSIDASILDTVFKASVNESPAEHQQKAWVTTHPLINLDYIKLNTPGAPLAIDNLIRLNVIREQGTGGVNLTSLGFSFVINCRMP